MPSYNKGYLYNDKNNKYNYVALRLLATDVFSSTDTVVKIVKCPIAGEVATVSEDVYLLNKFSLLESGVGTDVIPTVLLRSIDSILSSDSISGPLYRIVDNITASDDLILGAVVYIGDNFSVLESCNVGVMFSVSDLMNIIELVKAGYFVVVADNFGGVDEALLFARLDLDELVSGIDIIGKLSSMFIAQDNFSFEEASKVLLSIFDDINLQDSIVTKGLINVNEIVSGQDIASILFKVFETVGTQEASKILLNIIDRAGIVDNVESIRLVVFDPINLAEALRLYFRISDLGLTSHQALVNARVSLQDLLSTADVIRFPFPRGARFTIGDFTFPLNPRDISYNFRLTKLSSLNVLAQRRENIVARQKEASFSITIRVPRDQIVRLENAIRAGVGQIVDEHGRSYNALVTGVRIPRSPEFLKEGVASLNYLYRIELDLLIL